MALPTLNLPPRSAARLEEILRPPQPWFVLLTLLLAILVNLLPWSGVWQALKPDFLALVLLYWCIMAAYSLGGVNEFTAPLLAE